MFEKYAFARATFPHDGRHVAIIDLKVDIVENRPVAEPLGDILEFDQCVFHGFRSP